MVNTSRGGGAEERVALVFLAGFAGFAALLALAFPATFAGFACLTGLARRAGRAAFFAGRLPAGCLLFGVLERDRLAVVDLSRLAMTHPVSA